MHEITGLLVAMAVYAVATLLLFAPVVADIGGRLGPDFGDPLFNLYVMKWGARFLRQ